VSHTFSQFFSDVLIAAEWLAEINPPGRIRARCGKKEVLSIVVAARSS
jgi:hypothetical protein